MRKVQIAALSAGLALAACAVTPAPVPPPAATPSIPSAPLDLGGDWRTSSVGSTLEHFRSAVEHRYAQGIPLANIAVDLRHNEFDCRNGPRGGDGGVAPAQICRKTETVSGCTHTWQVHLFDANGDQSLARARALYDRRCGDEGLLGGPG